MRSSSSKVLTGTYAMKTFKYLSPEYCHVFLLSNRYLEIKHNSQIQTSLSFKKDKKRDFISPIVAVLVSNITSPNLLRQKS